MVADREGDGGQLRAVEEDDRLAGIRKMQEDDVRANTSAMQGHRSRRGRRLWYAFVSGGGSCCRVLHADSRRPRMRLLVNSRDRAGGARERGRRSTSGGDMPFVDLRFRLGRVRRGGLLGDEVDG